MVTGREADRLPDCPAGRSDRHAGRRQRLTPRDSGLDESVGAGGRAVGVPVRLSLTVTDRASQNTARRYLAVGATMAGSSGWRFVVSASSSQAPREHPAAPAWTL